MAKWTILKSAIADAIKNNGNQEITGQVLQNVLNSIVSSVGENATFAGVATPTTNPGTPDGNVFYLACKNGAYANFGGFILNNPGLVVLYNITGTWQNLIVYECLQELGDSTIFPVSQKTITDLINKGYQFRGFANPDTDPGTPEIPVFYFANTDGTYANFGGLEVNGEVVILHNSNNSWVKKSTGFATSTKVTEIEAKIEKTVSEEDVNVTNEADKYLFIDGKGNVILKIDKNGPNACSYNIIDPSSKEIIGSINKDFFDKINNVSIEDIYPESETDKFSFSDKFGREIAHIDKKGVTSASFFTKNGKNIGNSYIHPLFGKRVWGFGDSHCGVDNCKIWMQRLEEVTGCIIDYIENSRLGIRYTGDTTSSIFKKYEQYIDTNQKSLAALREEVDSGRQEEPDVIFLEQTHYVFDDEISNEPFVGSQIIEYNSEDSPFASANAMDLAIEDNTIQSYIDTLQDKLSCTVLKMYYSFNSKVITFTSSGNLHAGSFSLNIGDNVFSVEVSEGDTISQALTKLNEWVFSDNSDWANVNPHTEITTNKLTINYIGSGSPQANITVTDSGTGISLDNVSDSVSVNFKYLLFMSHNPSDWSNKDKWKLYDRNTNHYGYSIIKGMIELAQKLFPKTIFVLWYPNSLNLSNGVANYADGSLNYYATRSNNYWSQEELKGRDAWKACAELYSCRFIDVSRNSNISLINYSSWYKSEIHPINAGYERWGDIIALLY